MLYRLSCWPPLLPWHTMGSCSTHCLPPPQRPSCRATPQPSLSPVSVFAGALPPPGQDLIFALDELHGVAVGQFLQSLWVPVDDSSAPSNILASASHSHPAVWCHCHYVMSVFFTSGSTSLIKVLNGTGPRTDMCVVLCHWTMVLWAQLSDEIIMCLGAHPSRLQ